MIRAFYIFCKLNLIKISDKDIFDKCIDSIDLHHQICPYCGCNNNHTFHSYYDRNMITISEGLRFNLTVSVPRIKCSCGRTHAIIPDILIPYGSYSLRFIITVLCSYLTRNCSINELCDKFEISKSTLYDWIHLFVEHYNLWVGAINEIHALTLKAINFILDTSNFTSSFFKKFKFSFLQPYHITTDYDTC